MGRSMSIRTQQLLVSASLKPCSHVLVGKTGPQEKKMSQAVHPRGSKGSVWHVEKGIWGFMADAEVSA